MSKAVRRYRWLARFWGHCFVVAGVLFAVVPGRVVDLLTWEGSLLGLGGEMRFGDATLAWALTLSLMATLVWLAYRSAARPRDPGPYRAIMLSKLMSTAVFLYLAFVHGPVWVMAASADFFVAVTLFAVRLPVPDEGPLGGFVERYLAWMGVDAEGQAHVTRALEGLPVPVQGMVRFANAFFTYGAPLLLAGQPRTARRLDDTRMAALVERIRASRSAAIRGLWLAIHQPACGALARARCTEQPRAEAAGPKPPANPAPVLEPAPAE